MYVGMAGAEGGTVDDAALLLGPGLAVRVGGAGVSGGQSVRARWGEFPAVAKLQHVAHHRLAPCGEVVDGIVVKVPAQPADPPLQTDGREGGSSSGRVQEGPWDPTHCPGPASPPGCPPEEPQ